MNNPLPSVTYVTIKQLLLNRLQTALGLYIADASVLSQHQHISLHRVKDNSRVLYSCAIALQLSRAYTIPALGIANAIATLIRQGRASAGASLSYDFTVFVVPPGWIHLELTEPAIAAWLQRLVQGESKESLSSNHRPSPLTSSLFTVQYAHARCCSLVQMAHREGLITLIEPIAPSSLALFHIVAPDPIPWLNSDQIRLAHLTERALIAQLLELWDDLYCPSRQPINCEKAALRLSQAFQTFYSCCRIWGEVKIQTIHLAQARLGLIMATQPVLRLLLHRLGVPAPVEL